MMNGDQYGGVLKMVMKIVMNIDKDDDAGDGMMLIMMMIMIMIMVMKMVMMIKMVMMMMMIIHTTSKKRVKIFSCTLVKKSKHKCPTPSNLCLSKTYLPLHLTVCTRS